MKELILELIKKYYLLGLTVKDTLITGHGAKQVVRMMINRTSVAWDVKDRSDNYDDEKTKELLEKERKRIAKQTYEMTKDILEGLKKMDEALEFDERRDITQHDEMMSWSIRQLIRIDVISPYDIMYLAAMEKGGVDYGFKREAETKTSTEETAFEELDKRTKEVE